MERLIEISAILAGAAVFVLLAVASWMSDRNAPRTGSSGERFIPGNYDGHPHHGDDGGFGHHS
jgi:hypothetical protein